MNGLFRVADDRLKKALEEAGSAAETVEIIMKRARLAAGEAVHRAVESRAIKALDDLDAAFSHELIKLATMSDGEAFAKLVRLRAEVVEAKAAISRRRP